MYIPKKIRTRGKPHITLPGVATEHHRSLLHKSQLELQYDIFFIHIYQELTKCHKKDFTTPPMTIQVPWYTYDSYLPLRSDNVSAHIRKMFLLLPTTAQNCIKVNAMTWTYGCGIFGITVNDRADQTYYVSLWIEHEKSPPHKENYKRNPKGEFCVWILNQGPKNQQDWNTERLTNMELANSGSDLLPTVNNCQG